MNIFAMDDERFALDSLTKAIRTALPGAFVYSFSNADELLAAGELCCEVAFLDIHMYEDSGLDTAKRLKDKQPKANIVFVTGHSEYALEAHDLHASGYLLKPVTAEAVGRELKELRYTVLPDYVDKKVRVQTFGNFEVFYKAKPLKFRRSKSKEIFAYLVARRGTGVTGPEITAVLWDDGGYNRSQQKQIQVYLSEMIKAFIEVGANEIIVRRRNMIMVDKPRSAATITIFSRGDTKAVNSYTGEYMNAYSWAEFTVGFLNRRTGGRERG